MRSELPAHSANIRIKVLALRDDYIKETVDETAGAQRPASSPSREAIEIA